MADRAIYSGDDINSGLLKWHVAKHVSSDFTGATDDSHGDTDSGTPTPTYTIFSVTGDIIIRSFWGVVNTTLTDVGNAATLEIGVTGNTTGIIGATDSDLIIDGAVWASTTPLTGVGGTSGAGLLLDRYLNDGVDIIETSKVENILAGQIDYYMIWAPVEPGAGVVEAGTLS